MNFSESLPKIQPNGLPAKIWLSLFSSMQQDEIIETLLKDTAGEDSPMLTDEREEEVMIGRGDER